MRKNICFLHFSALLFTVFTRLGLGTAQFSVEPVSVVQAEGLEAVFKCLHNTTLHHLWGYNGTFFSLSESPFRSDPPMGNTPAKTFIPALPKYNNTIVQCEAVSIENQRIFFEYSPNASLIVQGSLESVIDLFFDETLTSPTTILISWSAPFSLDLTTADPDIQYCVDVYNVTGGGSHHLDSVCGITDTQYNYTAPDPTGVYNFTVTPRSNIQGSRNGTTSQPVQGYTIQLPIVVPSKDVEVTINASTVPLELNVGFPLRVIEDTFPGRVPTSYALRINNSNTLFECLTAATVRGDKVVLRDIDCGEQAILKHQIFNMSVVTKNSAGNSISDPREISTHDTQLKDAAYSNETQLVVVSCSYLEGSLDLGYFVIVSSESGFNYGVVYRNGSEELTVVGIDGTNGSQVFVFDLIDSETPEDIPAINKPFITRLGRLSQEDVRSLHTTNSRSQPEAPLTVSEGRICLQCYPDNCVGIIHSFDNYLNLMVLKYNSAKNSDNICTNSLWQGTFPVAVFGATNGTLDELPFHKDTLTIKGNDVTTIAVVGGFLVFFCAVTCLIITCVVIKCLRVKKGKQLGFPGDIENVRESFVMVETPKEGADAKSGVHSDQLNGTDEGLPTEGDAITDNPPTNNSTNRPIADFAQNVLNTGGKNATINQTGAVPSNATDKEDQCGTPDVRNEQSDIITLDAKGSISSAINDEEDQPGTHDPSDNALRTPPTDKYTLNDTYTS